MAQMSVERRRPPTWGFGDRLRLVRRELGYTQAEMAVQLGCGLKAYSAWESGASRPADLVAVAEHLEMVTGIARGWWLGWGEDAAPPPHPSPGLPRLDSNQQPAGSGSPGYRSETGNPLAA